MSDHAYDVIVCGGGTAGAVAAIAAARMGSQTLVVEQLGSLGGTQANGWVTPMMPNYIGDFKLSRGISRELSSLLAAEQAPGALAHSDEWYDPTMLAIVLDRAATKAGVTCLFNATLFDVKASHARVDSIHVATRGGNLNLSAKCFLDCTGDGELSALAGAEIMAGNEEGEHQPMTLRFTMGGIDLARARISLQPYLRLDEGGYMEAGYGEAKDGPMGPLIQDAISSRILEPDDLGYFQFLTVNGRTGELAFNAPRIAGLDPLDAFQMSRAYQVGREKIYRIAHFMKQFDGFQNAFISTIAPLMGIRESRRVVGDYVLTEDDHQSCRKFDDVVARNRYPVDIHLKQGLDYRKFPPGEWHDIPYRCLTVRGFDNLWVAGRCASATFVAQSAIRIQPVCRAMGEAAGVAASLCAIRGIVSRALPYSDLAAYLDLSVPESA